MIKVDKHNVDAQAPIQQDANLFITIFTDASWCPNTKAFGCAFWLKDGSTTAQTFKWGGAGCTGAENAELEALVGAINHIKRNCHIEDRVIILQSDCINALNKLDVRKLKQDAKFVKLKHVKAHTSHQTRRTYVNNLVDSLAKQQMKIWRAAHGTI